MESRSSLPCLKKPAIGAFLETYESFPCIYIPFLLGCYVIVLYTPGCFKLVPIKIFHVLVISFIHARGPPTEQVGSSGNAACIQKVSDLNLVWETNSSLAKHHYSIIPYSSITHHPQICARALTRRHIMSSVLKLGSPFLCPGTWFVMK
jgi:hypothetical protein